MNFEKITLDNKVTQEHINDLLSKSKYEVATFNNKTTVVVLTLPNGFSITESSSCIDPSNYDEDLGKKLCMERIENKLWELEGYLLQQLKYEKENKYAKV